MSYIEMRDEGESPVAIFLAARNNGYSIADCTQLIASLFALSPDDAGQITTIADGIASLSAVHGGKAVLPLLERELCLYHEARGYHQDFVRLVEAFLDGTVSHSAFEETLLEWWADVHSSAGDSYFEQFDQELRQIERIMQIINGQKQGDLHAVVQSTLETFRHLGW